MKTPSPPLSDDKSSAPLGVDEVEFISRAAEDFDGLPLGYIPIILVVVIAVVCLVAWFIAKRELGDK